MLRRLFLSRLAGVMPLAGLLGQEKAQTSKPLKIMMKSAWGSDDPTRASFPFLHGLALADAGHEVQIFLTGEATYLMRQATADQIQAVGWPSLKETRDKVLSKQIKVFS
jgi:predicted peroxiredoxin